MNLIERLECPFCKNNEFKTLYKIKYCDEKLKKFISEYYKSNFLKHFIQQEFPKILSTLGATVGIFYKNHFKIHPMCIYQFWLFQVIHQFQQ